MRTISNNRVSAILIVLLIGLFFVTSTGADTDNGHDAEITSPQQQIQTECPVMVGNKIDPNINTVYQGKKVLFCCQSCKTKFGKNPEKYLHRLPQFASVAMDGHAGHDHASARSFLLQLIIPMGIATLSLVGLTVAVGVFRRRWNPRLMLKIHKTCGVLALVVGASHAALVIFLH